MWWQILAACQTQREQAAKKDLSQRSFSWRQPAAARALQPSRHIRKVAFTQIEVTRPVLLHMSKPNNHEGFQCFTGVR